ncbi:MAG: DUF3018 family protein [Gammaproteobacteria bacterium]|nr:DUF3018 family protein [Gammaproteobacteria bacterium]
MVRKLEGDRTSRYRERQKAQGLRKVCIWVPAEDVERVKAYVARLRKKRATK